MKETLETLAREKKEGGCGKDLESLKKAFLVIDMAAILELTVLFFFFFPYVFESVSEISRNLSLFFGIPEVIFIMRGM